MWIIYNQNLRIVQPKFAWLQTLESLMGQPGSSRFDAHVRKSWLTGSTYVKMQVPSLACFNMSQPRLNHVFRFRTRLDLWPSLWQATSLQVFPAAIQSTPRNDDLSHHIIRGGPQLFLPPVIAPEKKTMTYLWLGKINHKDGCLHLPDQPCLLLGEYLAYQQLQHPSNLPNWCSTQGCHPVSKLEVVSTTGQASLLRRSEASLVQSLWSLDCTTLLNHANVLWDIGKEWKFMQGFRVWNLISKPQRPQRPQVHGPTRSLA